MDNHQLRQELRGLERSLEELLRRSIKYYIFINLPIGEESIEKPWKVADYSFNPELEVDDSVRVKLFVPKFYDYQMFAGRRERREEETRKEFSIASTVCRVVKYLSEYDVEVAIYLNARNLSEEITERTKTINDEEYKEHGHPPQWIEIEEEDIPYTSSFS